MRRTPAMKVQAGTNRLPEVPDAIVLADKPAGITSADLVKKLVKLLGRRAPVGHTGTLDKFATGLMILLTGRATSFAQVFLGHGKSYEAEFFFGRSTDTMDPEGETTEERPEADALALLADRGRIHAALETVRARPTQIPPQFSALKKGGRRASDLAREGKVVEIAPRPVTISEAVLLRTEGPAAAFRFSVSSGTYVRAIARDLGTELGFPVHVQNLRRISIDTFSIGDPRIWHPADDGPVFIDPLTALPWPRIALSEGEAERVMNGQTPRIASVPAGSFFLLRPDGRLLAWADGSENHEYAYRRVFV